MKTKMGRPKLPEGKAKCVQIGVRFTAEENKMLSSLAWQNGQARADWIRDLVLSRVEFAQLPDQIAEGFKSLLKQKQ